MSGRAFYIDEYKGHGIYKCYDTDCYGNRILHTGCFQIADSTGSSFIFGKFNTVAQCKRYIDTLVEETK